MSLAFASIIFQFQKYPCRSITFSIINYHIRFFTFLVLDCHFRSITFPKFALIFMSFWKIAFWSHSFQHLGFMPYYGFQTWITKTKIIRNRTARSFQIYIFIKYYTRVIDWKRLYNFTFLVFLQALFYLIKNYQTKILALLRILT